MNVRAISAAAIFVMLIVGLAPRVADAQSCTAATRATCDAAEAGCLRDCSDMTRCVRRCCEARHECQIVNGCAVGGRACPR